MCYTASMSEKNEVQRQLLVSIGLSPKEAEIYELLLTQGEMTGGSIEKESRQKKNTYTLLKSLQRRQLVGTYEKEGKRWYVPAPPEQLEMIIKEQKRTVLQTQSLLEQSLPEMSRVYKERVGRPVVRYFSGLTGLREVMDEVYAEGKDEVLSCVGNESPDKRFHEEISEKYLPLRKKNKIWARTISPDSPRAREFKKTEKEDLKEKILVDPKKYPMPAEFDTWGDTIALMSFARKDFTAILINHPDLSTTLQSLLRLAMDVGRRGDVRVHDQRVSQ